MSRIRKLIRQYRQHRDWETGRIKDCDYVQEQPAHDILLRIESVPSPEEYEEEDIKIISKIAMDKQLSYKPFVIVKMFRLFFLI